MTPEWQLIQSTTCKLILVRREQIGNDQCPRAHGRFTPCYSTSLEHVMRSLIEPIGPIRMTSSPLDMYF